MPTYPRPRAGQPRAPLMKSASFVSDLVDVVNAYKRGGLSGPGESERHPWIENGSGSDRTSGEILQIDSMTQPSSASVEGFFQSPTLEAVDPVWHTAIDNLMVVHAAVLDGQMIAYQPRRWAMVLVTITASTDRWVMPDPATPYRMKTSQSGVWKILGLDTTNNRAMVDLTQSQPIWRYELTENSLAPSDTTAKLVTLDGTVFSTSVELSDPLSLMDDQVTGDEGFCIHVGNKFYAIQGPC